MKCKIALIAALVANLMFSSVTFAHSSDVEKYTPINSAGYSENYSSLFDDKDSVSYYSSDNPFKNYRGSNRHDRGHDDDYYKPQF